MRLCSLVLARRRLHAWSFRVWQPRASFYGQGTIGSPKFLENPVVLLPYSQTPAGPPHQAITVQRHGPRPKDSEGSSRS